MVVEGEQMDATSSLPTGTVTFLLTDIEGSTQLWERYPEAMHAAVARHDALLTACIQRHWGTVVRSRGEGDSFFAVFARATEALAAACALQQALFAEPWAATTPLRVRVGLNTGEAQLREGDYYGRAINRCARVRALGHGGQTLLSLATCELVCDDLPQGVSLQDLGTHRLKDLQRPEQVFQLLHPDLPAHFPPLKSLDVLPNNLPVQLTSFIGREREMADVKRSLATTRLLTLTGPGGTGKTRLALQVAADLLGEYPDGVWLVELAALVEPALVPQAVASALGVREEPGRTLTETLADSLRPKQLLLVLDNCEHLVAASATLAHALLRACPQLQFLTTSREALGITGETVFRVPSLSLPDPQRLSPVEDLSQYEAVRLFIDRSLMSQPRFAVTNENAPAVAQVCYRLDGIPLAIELAAARVKVLSVEQIAARLDDRFRLLTGGSRTALPRQQTLRASIDWSYDLLSEAERRLLRRLSVFAGGWTLGAAEAICAGDGIDAYEILDLLTQLVAKSLVSVDEQEAEARYRLLETIRQYGAEQLRGSGEEAALRGRHRDWYLALAEEAEPELVGPAQGEWLDRLEGEHANLRAALGWSVEHGEAEAGLRLGGALGRFWGVRGYLTEGRERLTELLALAGGLGRTEVRSKALHAAGVLAQVQGDYRAARALYEECLVLHRELGNTGGTASSLNNLGQVAFHQGDYATARSLYEQALAIRRDLGDKRGIASSLNNLGGVAQEQGDFAAARALYEECLLMARELGDRWGTAVSLNNLGKVAEYQGDYSAARSLYEECLVIERELGDRQGTAYSINNLGNVALYQGDYESASALYGEGLATLRELGDRQGIANSLGFLGLLAQKQGDHRRARDLYQESLALFEDAGGRLGIAACLERLGDVAGAQGQPALAARLFGAAEALREAIGASLSPADRDEHERLVAPARTALGEEAFAAAWAAGRAMTLDEATTCALENSSASPSQGE
jgi:predicted ATPase/class 3 adenylate cyclase/Tfp pilus assembly protein PilF